jgi:hypothetical protein
VGQKVSKVGGRFLVVPTRPQRVSTAAPGAEKHLWRIIDMCVQAQSVSSEITDRDPTWRECGGAPQYTTLAISQRWLDRLADRFEPEPPGHGRRIMSQLAPSRRETR